MITALILTHNEELHISRCVKSLAGLATRIIIVDSGSTDKTLEIAKTLPVEVYSNEWVNHSHQVNWALDNCSIDTAWCMRIDADEYIESKDKDNIKAAIKRLSSSVSGVTLRRRIIFMGKWIKWGGIYPRRMLRIWRTGQGRCESRWMDEHMVVCGKIVDINFDISDNNLKGLESWHFKHLKYAKLELKDLSSTSSNEGSISTSNFNLSAQAGQTRFLKSYLYFFMPAAIRPMLYFLYRYLIRLGFLDGVQGFYFHLFQSLWYRYLIEALKIEKSTAKS